MKMNKHRILWIIVAVFVIAIIVKCSSDEHKGDAPSTAGDERKTFPDFGVMIPADSFMKNYPGQKIFKLSQHYPSTLPGDDKMPAFFKIPFDDKSRWKEWLLAARDYCF